MPLAPFPMSIPRYLFLFLNATLLGTALFGAVFFFFREQRGLEAKRERAFLKHASRNVIASMSLEEKVGQLFHIAMRGKTIKPGLLQEIKTYKPGGMILFADNLGTAEEIKDLTSSLQKLSIQSSGIALWISTDQEGGHIKRVQSQSKLDFPAAMALGQIGNADYVWELAFLTGYELRSLGINWVLAPVLDINTNPANPVIHLRSFGSAPEEVARMAVAYVQGNRAALSLSVLKHFPGHGDTNMDSHLALPRINKSLAEILQVELLPFTKSIKEAQAEAIMSAHILFTSLDPEKPATLSPFILKKLLRQRLGFQGMLSTDAMEMKAITKRYKAALSARMAFEAGVDVLLVTQGARLLPEMYRALLEAFQNKSLSIQDLDAALERQLALKFSRGLFYEWPSKKQKAWQGIAAGLNHKQTLAKLQKQAKDQYRKLHKRYEEDMGISLNHIISREAIASLGRPFYGFKLKEYARIRLFTQSHAMLQAALRMGLHAKQIFYEKNKGLLWEELRKEKGDLIYLVHLKESSLALWRNMLQGLQSGGRAKFVALYTGNPFLDIDLPPEGSGAVLLSYSNTRASQEALVYRALYPEKKIARAKWGLGGKQDGQKHDP